MKNLTVICAPDSFKESMTAKTACAAMAAGIKKVFPNSSVIEVPMADGGEGTLEALVSATQGTIYTAKVLDPLGNEIFAQYAILGDEKTAVIEMAKASGLELLQRNKRNPMLTSTYGTGQLIKVCLDHNIDKILIGIGGSATNDGGSGMLQALGVEFIDSNNKVLNMNGEQLINIDRINIEHIDSRLSCVKIDVVCDVTNTLCGTQGAAYIYGPQKGATEEMVIKLDHYLHHFANIIQRDLHMDVLAIPGGGAAGGLGAGLVAFLNAKLNTGIDLVIKYSQLEEKIKQANVVFTGEGKIDDQTKYGKTPVGVSKLAKKYNIPVIAFAGKVEIDCDALQDEGIAEIINITPEGMELTEAIKKGEENLKNAVAEYMKRYFQ